MSDEFNIDDLSIFDEELREEEERFAYWIKMSDPEFAKTEIIIEDDDGYID